MANNKASNLWKKEDWLAVWIGFIVIAVACLALVGKRRGKEILGSPIQR